MRLERIIKSILKQVKTKKMKHSKRREYNKKYNVAIKRVEREKVKTMGTHSIRLGSILSFDEDKEKDMIEIMEYLNSTHTTGRFFSNLVRIAFDNPEIIKLSKDGVEKGKILQQMDEVGFSKKRDKFFKDIASEMLDIKKKIDMVYEMSLKTYTLAQMGKHLALEQKSENTLRAEFIIEKQLKDLQDKIGLTLGGTPFESGKLMETEKKADDILEYIIESYDNILNEIKERFVQQIPVQAPVQIVQQPIQQAVQQAVQQLDQAQQQMVQTQQMIQNTEVQAQPQSQLQDTTEDDDDTIIDFGDADMGALLNFFGE